MAFEWVGNARILEVDRHCERLTIWVDLLADDTLKGEDELDEEHHHNHDNVHVPPLRFGVRRLGVRRDGTSGHKRGLAATAALAEVTSQLSISAETPPPLGSCRSDAADRRRHGHHPAGGLHRRADRDWDDTPGRPATLGRLLATTGRWWHPDAQLFELATPERLIVRQVTLRGARSGVDYVLAESLVVPHRLPAWSPPPPAGGSLARATARSPPLETRREVLDIIAVRAGKPATTSASTHARWPVAPTRSWSASEPSPR